MWHCNRWLVRVPNPKLSGPSAVLSLPEQTESHETGHDQPVATTKFSQHCPLQDSRWKKYRGTLWRIGVGLDQVLRLATG